MSEIFTYQSFASYWGGRWEDSIKYIDRELEREREREREGSNI